VGGANLKAVLMSCLVALMLAACSEEPNREEADPAPQKTSARSTSAQRTVSGNTATQGRVTSEYVKDEVVLAVKDAELQRGQTEEEDEIVVLAVIGERAGERGCFLMEGDDWFALKRIIDSGAALPDSPRQAEDLWAKRLPADEFSGSGTYARSFYEDPNPDGEKLDLRETPFFAFCYVDADPGGTSGPTAWYDVAHVEGTPGASP
jgi:hypothetical protein